MNERIKALMGKTLDSEFSHTWDTMTYEGLLQFSEKFAALIVRECIHVALRDALPTWDNAASEANTQCVKIAADLKKHFGVE